MKALGRSIVLVAVATWFVFACSPGSRPPTAPIATAPVPPPAPGPEDTDSARDVTDERAPTKHTLFDIDTKKPIAGALMTMGERELVSGADGVIETPMRFAKAEPVIIRHPKYIAYKGLASSGGGPIYLRARTAASYAEVTGGAAAQTLRLGDVTIEIPGGAFPAGTKLDVGVLDDHAMPEMERPSEPNRSLPVAVGQIVVDGVGSESARFAMVAGDKPIKVRWKLKPADYALLRILLPEVELTAGRAVHRLPESSLRFDDNAKEMAFDTWHFSGATLTQRAVVERDKDGKLVALHWWRSSHDRQLEQRDPTPGFAECGLVDHPLTITHYDTEQTRVTGSYATNWKGGAKFDASLLAGAEGKLFGNGGKVLKGVTFSAAWDYARSHTGGYQFQSTNRITVQRTKTCPAYSACAGWLYMSFETDKLTIIHRSIIMSELEADPKFKELQDHMASRKGAAPTGSGQIETWQRLLDNSPTNVPASFDSIVHTETFDAETRRFVDAYMILESVPPTCRPDAGAAGGGGTGVIAGGGTGTTPLTPPKNPKSPCVDAHLAARPTRDPPPLVDSLIDPPGTKVADETLAIESTEVKITITAKETRVVGEGTTLREVARAVACCPEEQTKVTFVSEVALMLNAAQAGGYNAQVGLGVKGQFDGSAGVDIGIGKITGLVKADAALQGLVSNGWGNAVQKGFARARGSSREIAVKATPTTCSTKALFAYLYETTYEIQIVIKGTVYNSDKSFTATMTFYGSPVEGPELAYAHCSGTPSTHMLQPSTVGTVVPPGTHLQTPSTPVGGGAPTEHEHSMVVPKTPGTFCIGLEAGTAARLGDSYGNGELAFQLDGCLRILPNGRLWAIATPAWYHGPNGSNLFAFPLGVEGTLPLDALLPGVASNVTLFGRASGGYALSTVSIGNETVSEGYALLMPEIGARLRAGDHAFFGVTPLGFPIFFGGPSSPSVAYRLTVGGGAFF